MAQIWFVHDVLLYTLLGSFEGARVECPQLRGLATIVSFLVGEEGSLILVA
jgi:hypothetical protein